MCTHTHRTTPKLRSSNTVTFTAFLKHQSHDNICTRFLQFRLSLVFPLVMTHGSAVSIMWHQPDDPRNCNYASPSPPKPVRRSFILFFFCPFAFLLLVWTNSLIHVNELVTNVSCGQTLLLLQGECLNTHTWHLSFKPKVQIRPLFCNNSMC